MVEHHAPSRLVAPAVHGLEKGRAQARKRAGRRRRKSAVVSGVMFLIVGGAVGGAGYYLWQFYAEEQARNELDRGPAIGQREAQQMIDDFEDNRPLNGPGTPAFGVGDDQP